MTIHSPLSFSNIIELSLSAITLIVVTRLVIYLLKRMWHKKKYKLMWTPIAHIERRSKLSYNEFIQEYASVGKPVIITDAMKDWKASKKWTLDFFRTECGSLKVSVKEILDYKKIKMQEMTFADYIDYMTANDHNQLLYLFNFYPYYYPKLYEDYKVPDYFPNWFDRLPTKFQEKYDFPLNYLLIGPKDSSTGLHVDGNCTYAWLAMISGRKQWFLFPPDQIDFLYSGEVDASNPNLEKYPLYANAKPVETILEPGEIIYVPPCWWHQVKNLDDTISVSHNSINELNAEICFQDISAQNPINGFLLPLTLEFPLISRFLFAIGLL